MARKRDDKPSNQVLNAMRSWLRIHGLTASQAAGIVNSTRKAGEIDDALRAFLVGRVKVPKVKIMGATIPISSEWTYEKIIQPIQRALS